MKKNQRSIFISAGILTCGISQIITHFYSVSDLTSGIMMGIGFGIMILAFIKPKQKLAKK